MSNPTIERRVVPSHMAHYVIRTRRYAQSVAWYRTFFQADVVFANDFITFLCFDEEHHRIAIGCLPGLNDHDAQAAGIDHVAFSYATLGDLLFTYQRLRSAGIGPFMCLNHGPTTSLYFRDPDGAQVELQVDNFPTSREAQAFFHSERFASNPVGVPFDPDLLADKFERGEPVAQLLEQGSAPIASAR